MKSILLLLVFCLSIEASQAEKIKFHEQIFEDRGADLIVNNQNNQNNHYLFPDIFVNTMLNGSSLIKFNNTPTIYYWEITREIVPSYYYILFYHNHEFKIRCAYADYILEATDFEINTAICNLDKPLMRRDNLNFYDYQKNITSPSIPNGFEYFNITSQNIPKILMGYLNDIKVEIIYDNNPYSVRVSVKDKSYTFIGKKVYIIYSEDDPKKILQLEIPTDIESEGFFKTYDEQKLKQLMN